MMSALRVLVRLSFRSLHSHKVKGAIVGGILFFGTMLLVLGTALLDSVEASMERSVTDSVTGHLQIFAADAKDDLAIFGGAVFGEDIGEIPDFAAVKDVLALVPNVKAIVPMGINNAAVLSGNDFDRVLATLHASLRDNDREAATGAVDRLRTLADMMAVEYEAKIALAADGTELQEGLDKLRAIQSDAFWARYEGDPSGLMRFLDTEIAPLASAGRLLVLRSIGTDLQLYAKSFDRFELVEGEMVPPGKRGILVSKRLQERWIKHLVARGFDRLHEKIHETGQTIAEDPALQGIVSQNVRQYQRITYQLGPKDAAELEVALREHLGADSDNLESGNLPGLLKRYLDLDDGNFDARYAFFYDQIAPRIRLFDLDVGDIVTLRSVTQSGYFKSVDVKVYGTFRFKGLERSDLSGAFNLMDMMTYRELYGLMSDAQRAELVSIREEVGVEQIAREDAEDALFGGDEALVQDATASGTARPQGFEEFDNVAFDTEAAEMLDRPYTQEEIDHGLAQHAAIVLEDPDQMDETQAAIERAIAEHGLNLQVVDWQDASGLVGQFIIVIRVVLYVALTIIFLVALVIINNSMVMATMDRVSEIGTMRAMGAQRGFVMAMMIFETLMLGLAAGGLGVGAAVGIITWLHAVGIPATSDILVFLFSGPRLYPTVGITHIAFGVGVIIAVSVLATLYPARIATRVQPIEAMRTGD